MSITPSPPAIDVPVPQEPPPLPSPAKRQGWTPWRIVALVIGCFMGLVSLGLLAGGGWATWVTNTQRDSAGYLTAGSHVLDTSGYVVTTDKVAKLANGPYDAWLGTVRVRVTPTDATKRMFVGVAATSAVQRYLRGVDQTVVTDWFPYRTERVASAGRGPAIRPNAVKIWTNHVSGLGTQTLKWSPSSDTTVVVMNADGSGGVSAKADIGATIPDLVWLAVGLFIAGGVLLIAAVVLVSVSVVRASR